MISTINDECSIFLEESAGLPIIKMLPSRNDVFRRVKVRKKKNNSLFENEFNKSFFNEYNDIRNRAVFVNGDLSPIDGMELFYVFPIDGYRYMYSTEVTNSSELYKDTFDKLIDASDTDGMGIFRELLRMTYKFNDLPTAISCGCEIIMYDISHYYAIRAKSVDNYTELFYH